MNNKKPKAAVIMGSDSDLAIVRKAVEVLKKFDVEFEVSVLSAHRTPDVAMEYAKNAEQRGFEVIIAAAGKAAHLPGVIAALTILPVIGIPIKSSTMDGLDSLLSIVQMPSGIPVATVAIDGAENAGLLAVQILSLKHEQLKEKLKQHKSSMEQAVIEKNNKIKGEVF
ncbi:MAG: 5-(carboxyamino)imidazole ribonucleotide mutase [Clostridiales bacterium GWB2_37_7]|nr:MAG: 5-(carboxyamino)imidazole ribonucleotide mutase [Clostridiales bacterium GWB2_37_7]